MKLLGSFLTFSEVFKNIVTALAVLVGGVWAWYRFVLKREKYSKIEMTPDLAVLGTQNDYYIIELTVICENKGEVREEVGDFTFTLLTLDDTSPVEKGGEAILNELAFNKCISKGRWVPESWGYTFFDPGIKTTYSHITILPRTTTFVKLSSRFYAKDKKTHFRSCQKAFRLG